MQGKFSISTYRNAKRKLTCLVIIEAFQSAYESRQPFQCCNDTVPVSVASRFLSTGFSSQHSLLILELTARDPKYCFNAACGLFIPPQYIHG